VIQTSEHAGKVEILCRASRRERVAAGAVFAGVLVCFVLLGLASAKVIDIGLLVGPCGFEQRHGLPCPTCGWTRSGEAFVRGDFLRSYYLQPAAALMFSVLSLGAFLALFAAVFGVYFMFLRSFWNRLKLRYLIGALIIVIAGGWAVTLARALAARQNM
jgi:hypothetical protein